MEPLCAELFKAKLIATSVATVDDIIEDFNESLDFVDKPSKVISVCSNILKVIHSVPGACVTFAETVSKDLAKEIKKQLNIDVVLL